MRLSKLPLTTLKEVPADAEIVSHRLMLRAGLIRKLASGMYSWLPIGLRVLRKIERIVREEMDRAGALELIMPVVQPAELWQESGRWSQFGPELLRFNDRHERAFCLGPTHEEVITDIVRRELKSYRQLPVNYYQIQTKFRDEVRPRFGVMRAREFTMKDAYSFHLDEASLAQTYRAMYDAYTRMFTRMGLEFRAVRADSGSIGGSMSEEFHVLAASGEDAIVFSDAGDYAANIELAEAAPPPGSRAAPQAVREKVATPGVRSIEALSEFLGVPAQRCAKTLLVEAEDGGLIALVLRGDHELNLLKAQRLAGVASPLRLADGAAIVERIGCEAGYLGPVGLECTLYADHAAAQLADFVCGANENGQHLTGVNWGRDTAEPTVADIRNVVEGDPSPAGRGTLHVARGIEVGHIFQLGTKYSEAMNAAVLDESGNSRLLEMGCYGVGITRIAAAAIEQNNDDRGIIWPEPIAPFQVILLGLNLERAPLVADAAESLYAGLSAAGVEVLYDDRDARPGVKFAEADLLGIPHRLVVAERGLAEGRIEYRHRRESESTMVERERAVDFVLERIGEGGG